VATRASAELTAWCALSGEMGSADAAERTDPRSGSNAFRCRSVVVPGEGQELCCRNRILSLAFISNARQFAQTDAHLRAWARCIWAPVLTVPHRLCSTSAAKPQHPTTP
jgi:hypothetical protein